MTGDFSVVVESGAGDSSQKVAQQTDSNAGGDGVHAGNPVVCHLCGREFRKQNHLTQHLRSHSGLCCC